MWPVFLEAGTSGARCCFRITALFGLKSHYAIGSHNGITTAQFHAFVAILAEKCAPDMAANARAVLAQYLKQD